MHAERYGTRERLLSVAAGYLATEHSFNYRLPGANDDAEADYHEEMLIEAAREFVKAYEGYLTTRDINVASHRGSS